MSQLFRLCEELSTLEISYEGFVNEMDLGVDASGKEPFCQYVAVKDTLKFCWTCHPGERNTMCQKWTNTALYCLITRENFQMNLQS